MTPRPTLWWGEVGVRGLLFFGSLLTLTVLPVPYSSRVPARGDERAARQLPITPFAHQIVKTQLACDPLPLTKMPTAFGFRRIP